MSRRHALTSSLALAGLIAASACGSDDDPAAAETTAPDTVEAPAESDPTSGDEVDEHDDDEDHDDEHDDDEDHDDEHDGDHGDEDQDHSSGLDAHEHGTAELTVAWIDDEVAIDLISPAFNVFGFEYESTSEEDIATEADRTAALTGPTMIAVDDPGCTLTDPVETEVERDGDHSEITASWLFECDGAGDSLTIDLGGLFAEFPNFADIDAQWVTESNQSAAELTPSATSLSLEQ